MVELFFFFFDKKWFFSLVYQFNLTGSCQLLDLQSFAAKKWLQTLERISNKTFGFRHEIHKEMPFKLYKEYNARFSALDMKYIIERV